VARKKKEKDEERKQTFLSNNVAEKNGKNNYVINLMM